jgi:hypothetical protein
LYPTTDDFLILLTQSSYQQQQQQQQPLAINLNNNYDIIPFSIDNRLDGNIQFIFDLFTINQSYKIQRLLNKNSIEYNLNLEKSSLNQYENKKFFSQTTSELLNEIFQTMLDKFIEKNQLISYDIFNHMEHLLSSYLMISLINYSKTKQIPTQMETMNQNQPPVNIHLKPLFLMSIETLEKFFQFLLNSSLITMRLWHHLFSLLYYTSTNKDLAYQMKQRWFTSSPYEFEQITGEIVFSHLTASMCQSIMLPKAQHRSRSFSPNTLDNKSAFTYTKELLIIDQHPNINFEKLEADLFFRFSFDQILNLHIPIDLQEVLFILGERQTPVYTDLEKAIDTILGDHHSLAVTLFPDQSPATINNDNRLWTSDSSTIIHHRYCIFEIIK